MNENQDGHQMMACSFTLVDTNYILCHLIALNSIYALL